MLKSFRQNNSICNKIEPKATIVHKRFSCGNETPSTTKKLKKFLTKTSKIGLVCVQFYKNKNNSRQIEASNSGIIEKTLTYLLNWF